MEEVKKAKRESGRNRGKQERMHGHSFDGECWCCVKGVSPNNQDSRWNKTNNLSVRSVSKKACLRTHTTMCFPLRSTETKVSCSNLDMLLTLCLGQWCQQ